jgi:chromosome segregation ATPase
MNAGNGVDIAAVYQLLTEVARTVAGHDRKFDEIANRLDGHDRRADSQDRKLDWQDRKLDWQDRKLNEIILVVNQHTAKLDELGAVVNRHDLRLADLTTDIAGLRETLAHYHATVRGHGILYSELEERVRHIERHLRLKSQS